LDTKLKNYRYSVGFKFFAILLSVAGMLTLAYGLLKAPYFEVAVQDSVFKESSKSREILREAYQQISEIAFTYKNADYIKSGAMIDDGYISKRKNQIISDRENSIQKTKDKYNSIIKEHYNDEIGVDSINKDGTNTPPPTNSLTDSKPLLNTLVQERDKEIQSIQEKYNELLQNIKSDLINKQLSEYHKKIDNLNKSNELTGVYYTVWEANKVILSNSHDYTLSSSDAFYKDLSLSAKLTLNNVHYFFSDEKNYYYDTSNFPDNTIVYLGMSSEKYISELATYNQNMNEGLLGIKTSSIGFLVFLIGLIYLIYSSGRRVDKEGVHLLAIDHIYLDIALLVTIGAIALCMTPLFEYGRYLFKENTHMNTDLLLVIFSIIISIGTLIGILYVTIFSKRLKRHEVIKHTLIFKVYALIIQIIKSIYTDLFSKIKSVSEKSPLAKRLIPIFGVYALINIFCISLFFVGPIGLFGLLVIVGVNLVAINFLLKGLKNLNDIKDGAEKIRAGELYYSIPEQGIPELRQLAETINQIADGLKYAVRSQVKSEKMKSELITNVSHDLKTPLTSIITYVDLLKNEGLKCDNAEKYLGIIDVKSQRLKALTEDLFEAAKATSGSISVNLERLDVVSLVNQGLGELSDKIEASGLSIKTNFQSEKLYVNADGKLLWRVIENLLSNVFKYAMPNSRVYIEASTTAEHVSLIIKNISAYELNVNEEELMERFKRGDASRHSEGSGLGLSIAKSLTELQAGRFSIDIDGDLFKATIVLPTSK
jgi:signal transduction histidine kinase